MTLQPHQQRVVEECAEVVERLAKLRAFLPTEFCLSLPFAERNRLVRQERAMLEYVAVLNERIEAFQ